MSITATFSHPLIRIALQAVGPVGGTMADWLENYCRDPSQALPKALEIANQQTWQAIELALAGDTLTGKLKQRLAGGRYQGALTPLRQYLNDKSAAYRDRCLVELQAARAAQLLDVSFGKSLAMLAGTWERLDTNTDLLEQAQHTITAGITELTGDYPRLAELLCHREAGGPLLIILFGYFLNQAIGDDEELRDELNFKYLRQLWKAQKTEFAALQQILVELGADLAEAFTALATHIDGRFDRLEDGISTLQAEVRVHLEQLRQPGPVTPSLTQIIQDPHERQLVREFLHRLRALPASEQTPIPELLNQLGKLQVASGDLPEAKQLFQEANDAEGHYNFYRVALEEHRWQEALPALRQAATADPSRFAPFPLHKFTPERILGAGGFGVAFLCKHNYLQHTVVVKSIYAEGLARTVSDIFREGCILKTLHHPAIIQVEDTDYADQHQQQHPYLTMEYFAGSQSLGAYLQTHGALPVADVLIIAHLVAEALAAAHQAGILHRDLKPDNLLVKRENSGAWQVKLIDFGMAARQQLVKQSLVASSFQHSLLGSSLGGTYHFAAPEQLGLRAEKIGCYSDVYGYGKTLCFALFQMTEPTLEEWQQLGFDHPLVALLNRCIHTDPTRRPQNFAEVLQALSLNAAIPAEISKTAAPQPSIKSVTINAKDAALDADIKTAQQAEKLDLKQLQSWLHEHSPTRLTTWRSAAEQGHVGAQWLLGECFFFGAGVEQDERQALEWFRKAAAQGHADGQYNLGSMYAEGLGVEQDERQALKWFRKAAAQGQENAKKALQILENKKD